MKDGTVLLLLALVVAAFATAAAAEGSRERSYGASPERSHESYESEEPKYEYSYTVKDNYGNDYGHEEQRDGDYTEGSYFNHLPDGRLQRVSYVVDGYSGFLADVQFDGAAHYDSTSRQSRESYYRQRGDSRESREKGDQPELREREESRSEGGDRTFESGHKRQRGDSRGSREHQPEPRRREESGSGSGSEDSVSGGGDRPVYFRPRGGSSESKEEENQPESRETEESESEGGDLDSVFGGGNGPVYYRPRVDAGQFTVRVDEDDSGDSSFVDVGEFFQLQASDPLPAELRRLIVPPGSPITELKNRVVETDFIDSSEFFSANFTPQIRYQP